MIDDLQQIDHTNFYALAISSPCSRSLSVSKKISKEIPGALMAVDRRHIASSLFNLEAHGVQCAWQYPKRPAKDRSARRPLGKGPHHEVASQHHFRCL